MVYEAVVGIQLFFVAPLSNMYLGLGMRASLLDIFIYLKDFELSTVIDLRLGVDLALCVYKMDERFRSGADFEGRRLQRGVLGNLFLVLDCLPAITIFL